MSTDPKLLDHRGRPRAVVTGIGVKSPAGCDVDTFWSTVVSGRSTAKRTQLFDPSELPVQFGCEVLDFDPVAYLGPKESRRLDRFAQLGVCAAADAFEDAGELGADPARCAVVTGTGVGGIHTLEEQQPIFMEKGALRVSPFYVPMMMANAAAGHISMRFRFTGPNVNITTACAAGSNAIGEALRLIRDDTSDVVMAGGCEAGMTAMTVAAFARMGALSTRNEAPELASRPFDIDRDGFVIGEGAAFFVMESLERALARGAHIYGEVTGYGRNADAHHITAPAPGGVGAAAMRWPVTPLVDVTGGACSPKTLAMASASPASLSGVEVPWALMCTTWAASMRASSSASCMHAAAPTPPGAGAVMWCASALRP
jgi:3-oxoacyl-[acyl-carrier-protein] synthase II